jgi:hypothetical protein
MMVRDFGAGLTIDEMIGMRAGDINVLTLPNEKAFSQLKIAAAILCGQEYGGYLLMELWGSGETVWMGANQSEVVQVSPSGQIQSKGD